MLTAGHPVVYAEWLAAGPQAPTVLIYGHYDVQPPDPLDLWETPPFEPTVVGDDLFARGAADDKGQLYIHVKAAQAFKETLGAPPVNVRCIFEGEEEVGSPSLEPFIRQHVDLLAADVAVISDTHILGPDLPAIVYALRGIAYVEVELTGPDHDLHSGAYGGAVLNPINALCRMIARLQDADGHITIPGFYDAVRELAPDERAGLAQMPFDRDAWLEEAGVPTDWGESDYTIVERTTARPTLDVNGIWGGYIEAGAKTVLPSKAYAKISMRLVPDQDPAQVTQLVRDYLAQIAPPEVDLQVRSLHGGNGALVRRDSPAMQAAVRAYATSFGREPLFVRGGGSIPVVVTFQEMLGIESLLLGFGLPDDRLHSPNEKFHLPNFYRGIDTIIHFMQFLGE
jgi:acetylornithine deacetylase/succinyl-diaminopimelate desuccinylase-like protein